MITIEDIIEAYKTARKNKRRSRDQVEFELHWEARCMALYEAIVSHQLRPTAYTFIVNKPRPREVFASDMDTRVLHHYLDMRLRPLLEKRLSKHTFNNRVGMGQNACQNALIKDIYEVSKGHTQDAWVIKLDLSGCFPNVLQDVAYKQLEEVILSDYNGADKDELIYILQSCVYSYPTEHCFRKSHIEKWKEIPTEKSLFSKPLGVGAAIGHLLWQNAVNYYFHELDEWAERIGIHMERFVDDMYFVTNNKAAFLPQIDEIRKILGSLGAKLNEHKFYCQHYTKGVECVGVHIKKDRVYLNRRTIRNAHRRIKELNRCARPGKVKNLLSSVNSYMGMMKNLNGYRQAKLLTVKLNPRWSNFVAFNRRRVCMEALPEYKERNLIIKQYNLK